MIPGPHHNHRTMFFLVCLVWHCTVRTAVFVGRKSEGQLFFLIKLLDIFFCSCKQIWTPDCTITGQCFFWVSLILSWLTAGRFEPLTTQPQDRVIILPAAAYFMMYLLRIFIYYSPAFSPALWQNHVPIMQDHRHWHP